MTAPDTWPRDPVAETRELLEAAEPAWWPHGVVSAGDGTLVEHSVIPFRGDCGESVSPLFIEHGPTAELIAAAPRLLAALADEVERLRSLT